jgi:hypothetical protein
MNSDFPAYLNDTVQRLCSSVTVNDSIDAVTTQLLLFIRDVNDKLDIII